MEFPDDFRNKKYGKGSLLIANPVLPDPNFSRTVILLCNHNEQGSFGLGINRTTTLKALDLFSSIDILLFTGIPIPIQFIRTGNICNQIF